MCKVAVENSELTTQTMVVESEWKSCEEEDGSRGS